MIIAAGQYFSYFVYSREVMYIKSMLPNETAPLTARGQALNLF